MSRCLSCEKPLTSGDTVWHTRCIKIFFWTSDLPTIALDSDILDALGSESTRTGLTVPRVQKKRSPHLETYRGNGILILIGHLPGYILKLHATE